MKSVESPADLVDRLVEHFPALVEELAGETIESHHQVFLLVSHRFAALLEASPERTVRSFCDLVDSMVLAGGVHENAISTCVLEHASQLGIRKIIRPLICPAAKNELR